MQNILTIMEELDKKYADKEMFKCVLGRHYMGVLKIGDREMEVYASELTGHRVIDGVTKHTITLIEI